MIVEQNVPLQAYNSFGIVAKARTLVRVGSEADVQQLLADPALAAAPKFVLGGGSNIVLTGELAKRNVDVRYLDKGDVQKIGGDRVKQVLKVRNGIETEQAKKITRLVKDSKLKVQAAIQGDAVRITGAKRDDLQAAMALIKKDIADLPLSFNNFRD